VIPVSRKKMPLAAAGMFFLVELVVASVAKPRHRLRTARFLRISAQLEILALAFPLAQGAKMS
jgi:hypothetical protein